VSVQSKGAALSALARLSLVRLRRGKTLWIALGIALFPVFFATQVRGHGGVLGDTFVVVRLILAIVPALLVAAPIGEEIEDRTATYLWSRPLARWTVVVGKLIALAPIAIIVMCASWLAAGQLAGGHLPSPQSFAALAAGTLAVSVVVASIATVLPKHGMALAIVYVMFDLLIGELPASLQQLSITRHTQVLAGLAKAPIDATTIAAILAIPAVWLAIALQRIRKLEA
jgi:hypothetical protein